MKKKTKQRISAWAAGLLSVMLALQPLEIFAEDNQEQTPVSYQLTITKPDHGMISVESLNDDDIVSNEEGKIAYSVNAGEEVKLMISADEGYTVSSIEIKDEQQNDIAAEVTENGAVYAFDMPEKNVYVKIYKQQGVDVVLSEQVEYLPPEEKIGPFKDYEKDINMYSIINTFTELGRQKIPNTPNLSMLDLYFSERPPLDRAKLKYASIEMAGDRTKGSVYANMMAKMTIFTYENIAKMTAESSIQLKDIGFGEKPIAVFLGIPDYDRSTHFLASVFIRQVYFVLAKMCSKTSRCDRPVKFICDEFGNIPAIEAMANIITVCLGRNISFDLYIQSYSQLTNLYGDDAETIIGNCGNEIYILTKDENTADRFSKLIGNETITDLQRTGNKLSTSKTLTESNIEKPLLNVNQLITLEKGSCVVIRGMKRQDLQGNKIIPRPIYNCKKFKTEFKFRYTYLQDTFPDPDRIILSEVNTEDRSYIDQTKRVWDYDKTFRQFNEAENVREEDFVKKLKHMNGKYYSALKQSLKKIFGDDYEEKYGIDEEMPIEDFKIFIQDSRIKENDKKAILTVIQSERWSTDG